MLPAHRPPRSGRACWRRARHGVPFVARGSGTGLAGGATPLDGAVVIVLTKMDRVLSVDVENRLGVGRAGRAQPRSDPPRRRSRPALRPRSVEPAELLDRRQRRQQLGRTALPRRRRDLGPRPRARGRAARRLGGDARRRGARTGRARPAGGVRRQRRHVRHRHQGLRPADPEPAGRAHDAARLRPGRGRRRDRLGDHRRRHGAGCARDDGPAVHHARSRSTSTPACRPTRRRSSSSRSPGCLTASTPRSSGSARSAAPTAPAPCASPRTRPSGPCCGRAARPAFGAIARIKPNYYLHDTVVPRRKLTEVLRQVYEIAERHELLVMNVFHAGDGNLHPLLVFDGREPGVLDRVHRGGRGDRSGHGRRRWGAVGGARHRAREARLHAADVRSRRRSPPRRALRCGVRPRGLANPCKVLAVAGRLRRPASTSRRAHGSDRVRRRGRGRRAGRDRRARLRAAARGPGCASSRRRLGDRLVPARRDDGLLRRRDPGRRARRRRSPTHGQTVALPAGGTVGGALAVGHSSHPRASAAGPCATPCSRPATCRRPARSSRPAGRR